MVFKNVSITKNRKSFYSVERLFKQPRRLGRRKKFFSTIKVQY